jgi:flagellar biosynthesis protein FlhB
VQEQEQNRTEQATPFKLSEAKKRGQVAKSLDFNTLVMAAALLMAMAIWGSAQWRALSELWIELFASADQLVLAGDGSHSISTIIGRRTLDLLMPFFIIGLIAAVFANLVQTGPIFSTEPIKPKFERINPVAGFKRVFNKRMLFEALKSVVKLVFLGVIVYAFLFAALPGMLSLSESDAGNIAQWLGENALALVFRLGLGLLLIGIIDITFVRWQFGKQMMMSRREVKEEVKRREGDPQIRAKIRELQRENLKQARSLGKLPDADVLITNPTHFAVALRYDRATMNAPIVLAKGTDHWVSEMKTIARQNGIPIMERRRLARVLFKHGLLDRPIPEQSFIDVARVYAELGDWRRRTARYEVTA